MKLRWLIFAAQALLFLAALGCEEPASVARVGKPPGGGGGPREIAFVESGCIRAMAVDGSNVATIHCPGSNVSIMDVSWDPSGAAVAYTVLTGNQKGLWRVNVDGTNKIQLLDAVQCGGAGGAHCDDVDWSPLGDEIAVTRVSGTVETAILLLPATGCPWPDPDLPCPSVLYSEPAGYFHGIAWSPDATQLATNARSGADPGVIVLVERATGVATNLHPFGGSVADWGRGQRETFLLLGMFVGDTIIQDIYLYDLATPGVAPQLVMQKGRHPNFSPDGEFLVYQAQTGSLRTTKLELDTGTTTSFRLSGNHPDWRKPGPAQ